ncbi:MAG: hypothetical protein B7Y43_07900 [Sphingomonas sp. 28-62-20]|nr:MAG: hypothetical protein B7Y43_07900 [Sphingomonas sp. 28-62-20]
MFHVNYTRIIERTHMLPLTALLRIVPRLAAHIVFATGIAIVAALGWSSANRATASMVDRSMPSTISTEIAVGSVVLLVRVTAR